MCGCFPQRAAPMFPVSTIMNKKAPLHTLPSTDSRPQRRTPVLHTRPRVLTSGTSPRPNLADKQRRRQRIPRHRHDHDHEWNLVHFCATLGGTGVWRANPVHFCTILGPIPSVHRNPHPEAAGRPDFASPPGIRHRHPSPASVTDIRRPGFRHRRAFSSVSASESPGAFARPFCALIRRRSGFPGSARACA